MANVIGLLLSGLLHLIHPALGVPATLAALFLPPGGWSYLPGIEFGYRPAPLLEATFTLTIILSFIHARKKATKGDLAALSMFSAGLLGFITASSPLQLFFFMELMLLPAFYLILKEDPSAAFRYFAYMQASSVLVLAGLVSSSPALLSLGFAIKMGLFPFHGWLPEAHAQAPHYFSPLLSGAVVACGAVGLLRFSQPSMIIPALGILSVIYGALLAWHEEDIKKVLAYSTISQMGYAGLFLHFRPDLLSLFLAAHGLAKAALFLIAGTLIDETGIRYLDRIRARSLTLPPALYLSALSLAGFPPLLGFPVELGLLSSLRGWWLALFSAGLVLTALYVERLLSIFLHRGGGRVEDPFPLIPSLLLLTGVLLWMYS